MLSAFSRILDRLRFSPSRYPSDWAAGAGLNPAWLDGSAPSVESLLTIAAIARAETVIAETIAVLPRMVERAAKTGGATIVRNSVSDLLDAVSDGDIERLIRDGFRTGNFFLIIRRDIQGKAERLEPVSAWRVAAEITAPGAWRYRLSEDGELMLPEERIAASDMIHYRWATDTRSGIFGISPLAQCSSSAILVSALRNGAASYYKNVAAPGAIITLDKPLNVDAAARLKAQWEEGVGGRNRGRTAVLDNGAKIERIPFGTADEAQMSELLREATREVSRLTGVPQVLLSETSDVAYSSAAELMRAFRESLIRPLAKRIADEFTRKLFSVEERRRGLSVSLDISEVGRSDGKELAETNARLVLSGIVTPNEVRASLSYPSIEGGDDLLRPANMVSATDPTPNKTNNPNEQNSQSEPGPGGAPLAPQTEEPSP